MIYMAVFFLSFILTYTVRRIALRRSMVDIPNDRSSHSVPTPHGGGVAIALSWFLGVGYLGYHGVVESSLLQALLAGSVISLVSFTDDIIELSPKIRLLAQAFVAVSGLIALGGFQSLDLFFITIENPLVTNLFAFLLIIWFINLYNFLDGIDGYAGMEMVFLALAGLLLFGGEHFAVLAAAVLGFLFWNWHRAKIFMGDVGSTLLGYNVAVFTLYYGNASGENFWIWIILFALFWFDATLTLLRRKRNGEKLSQAHKKHGYQRLHQSGWKHDKITLYALGVNGVLLLFVFFLPAVEVAFIAALGLLYSIMRLIDGKKAFA